MSIFLRFFFHFIQFYAVDARFLYIFALNGAENGVSCINKSI